MAELKNVEIFAVGTWNRFKFVQEDLQQIVINTSALMAQGKHNPPIKLGHSTNQVLEGQEDGDPALGTPFNFRIDKDKIIADFQDLPDIIFKAIQKKRFTSVSVEMDHIKHFGWFITAVSLLGADLPAVKTIQDLQAFLSDDLESFIIDAQDSSKVSNSYQLIFSEPKFLNTSEDIGGSKMPDEQKDTAATQAILDKNRELEAKIAKLEAKDADNSTKFNDNEKVIAEYKAKETERSFGEKKETILKAYKEDSKAGKLPPIIVDKIEKHLDEQKVVFTENTALSISPELAREVGQAYSEKLDKQERAHDTDSNYSDDTPDKILEQEIAKVMATNSNLSWMEADNLVLRSQPIIYSEYQRWADDIAEGRVS